MLREASTPRRGRRTAADKCAGPVNAPTKKAARRRAPLRAAAWREITGDDRAKADFVRIMEQMDERYAGLGSPAPPLKNPLDQWIDQHADAKSPRGAAIFAWAPRTARRRAAEPHLVLAVTYKKSLGAGPGLKRLVIEMLGINPAVYPRPTRADVRLLGRVFFDKFVDLAVAGLVGEARPGASAVVAAFRPKSMTWKPAFWLHDCVGTDPCSHILRERDCGHSIYWEFKVSKP